MEIQNSTRVTARNEAASRNEDIPLSNCKAKIEKKPGINDFVGILSKKEAKDMRKAIEETCETINADDWK